MPGEIVGFWSYARLDDADDAGRILSLSRKIRSEFRLQTGDEIEIFVDRESLEWGTEWDHRISEAIAGTTFFIPIITPSYFRSQQCRNELLKFTREATRLGLEKLLMPVYWVTVSELHDASITSADEAIALIARHQWADLRATRLADEDSSSFRSAVAELASELGRRVAEIAAGAARIASSYPVPKSDESQGDDDSPGFLEVIAAGEEAAPRFNEIIEQIAAEISVIGNLAVRSTNKISAADESTLGVRKRVEIADALARDLAVPATNLERLAREYNALLGTMDPSIHAVLDMALTNTEGTDAELLYRASLLTTIQDLSRTADNSLNSIATLVESMRSPASASRSLRVPIRRIQTALQVILDGRALIDEWGRRAGEIKKMERRGNPDP